MVKTEDLNTPATKADVAAARTDMTAAMENLAVMVKDGFDEVGKKLEEMDGHILRIDSRLAKHQEMIETSKLNISTLDNRVVTIERKVGLPIKPLKI